MDSKGGKMVHVEVGLESLHMDVDSREEVRRQYREATGDNEEIHDGDLIVMLPLYRRHSSTKNGG